MINPAQEALCVWRIMRARRWGKVQIQQSPRIACYYSPADQMLAAGLPWCSFLLNIATPFTESSFWSSLLSSGCDLPYLPYYMPDYLLHTYFFSKNIQHLLICCCNFHNPDATCRLIAAIPDDASGDKNLCCFSSQGNRMGGQLMETITRFL